MGSIILLENEGEVKKREIGKRYYVADDDKKLSFC